MLLKYGKRLLVVRLVHFKFRIQHFSKVKTGIFAVFPAWIAKRIWVTFFGGKPESNALLSLKKQAVMYDGFGKNKTANWSYLMDAFRKFGHVDPNIPSFLQNIAKFAVQLSYHIQNTFAQMILVWKQQNYHLWKILTKKH